MLSQHTQKHLYGFCSTKTQRLRRWFNIVQMLYKCFVFTGIFLSRMSHNNADTPVTHKRRTAHALSDTK